jgi:hypothetical protein
MGPRPNVSGGTTGKDYEVPWLSVAPGGCARRSNAVVLRYPAGMPRPRTERQAWQEERVETPALIAALQRELAAMPAADTENRDRLHMYSVRARLHPIGCGRGDRQRPGFASAVLSIAWCIGRYSQQYLVAG